MTPLRLSAYTATTYKGQSLQSINQVTDVSGNTTRYTIANGTLTGVTALSGYVADKTGRLYTFSMLGSYKTNSPRVVFDKVGATLAGWSG